MLVEMRLLFPTGLHFCCCFRHHTVRCGMVSQAARLTCAPMIVCVSRACTAPRLAPPAPCACPPITFTLTLTLTAPPPPCRHYGTRGLGKEERLLLAFEHVDKTWKELAKAQANAMLLENDWRLGKLRLAAPMEGPHPPGYQAVDMEGCDPRHFMHQQLGR